MIGFSVANMDRSGAQQLELPFDGTPQFALDDAVDLVRRRYGTAALSRGVLLGRHPGLEIPHLPD